MTRSEVKRYIIENFAPDVRTEELADDYDLINTGVVDSLGLLRLIAWVGERCGIPVAEIDLEPNDFRSIQAIDEFIKRFSTNAGSLTGQ